MLLDLFGRHQTIAAFYEQGFYGCEFVVVLAVVFCAAAMAVTGFVSFAWGSAALTDVFWLLHG